MVLLIGYRETVLVTLENRRAQMVPALEPHARYVYTCRLFLVDRLRLDHRDPASIVHYVQRLPLEQHAARIALSVYLVAPEVDALLDWPPDALNHLARALA